MRQQLIQYLSEDIAPEIRKSGNAHTSILKFARDKNLAPAQVSMMGQLFNTARTLDYLEKSANRGGDFPIIDVPKLVEDFLEVKPEAVKQAFSIVEEDPSSLRLPDAFANVTHIPVQLDETYEEFAIPFGKSLDKRADAVRKADTKAELETYRQVAWEMEEDMRKLAGEIEYVLRTNSDISFTAAHADAWAAHGDDIQPAVKQAAAYMGANRWSVKLADQPKQAGVTRDHRGIVTKLVKLAECLQVKSAAEAHLKQAVIGADTAEPPPVRPETAPPKSEAANDTMGAQNAIGSIFGDSSEPKGGKPERPPKPESGGKPDGKKSGPSAAPGSTGFFEKVRGKMDELMKGPSEYVTGKLKGIDSVNNVDQRKIDTSHQDLEQVAMLQNLMLTDEVLSEADPDHVVAMFQTIRETAPSLARDPNIMRVALRQAVQHEGISPFDIKTLAETEHAKLKTDLHGRQMQNHLYRGAPLQPPQGPKGI